MRRRLRRRLLRLRRRVERERRVLVAGPAPHPGGEDEDREAGDRRRRVSNTALFWNAAAAARPCDPRPERALLLLFLELAAHVARVELVDVELAVEAEVVRVRAQEALDVRLRGQHLELLVLEGAQVLAADLRRLLDLRRSRDPAADEPRGGCCRSRTREPGVYDKSVVLDRSTRRARSRRSARGRRRASRGCARAAPATAPPARPTVRSSRRARPSREPDRDEAEDERRPGTAKPAWMRRRSFALLVTRIADRDRGDGASSADAAATRRPRGSAAAARYCLTYGRPTAAGGIERPITPATAISVRTYGKVEIRFAEMSASRWSGIASAKPKPKRSVATNAQPGPPLAEDDRRERDEAAAARHVLGERADEADRAGTRLRARRALPEVTTAA